jgi:lactate 2-monooxygenase
MADRYGQKVQAKVYARVGDAWVRDVDEWELRAAEILDRPAFDYIAGGAGGESSVRANREAFEKWALRPRMLTGLAEPDLSVEVLGTRSFAPFLLAPIGVQSIAHPEAELAVARAAALTGIPFVVSTASSTPMEAIAQALGTTPRWFQLYWVSAWDVVASLVERAEATGHSALVVTVDTGILGWRGRDLRHRYLPFLEGAGLAQFTSDPVFCSRLAKPPDANPAAACAAMLAMFSNPTLAWKDMAWLRKRTRLPMLAKGILTADDARRAVEAGFDGIIVSNHGGRQVDGAIAALDALTEVRAALGSSATVLMDGGIRRAADVIKALALGANAVLLGRPYMYGLAVGGQTGVEQVIRTLIAELDVTLTLLGAPSTRTLDRSYVARQA